ncbi:4-hydroxy-tetrahydrodipicolinate synthase [Demequina sp. B12]|uniref:4-hydroxy-tetrahydrodipicolinate synthase n=1 Tax=Demequina sp. B12 TaxID=2992757 RepID=UPI00237AE535|nr:4-hydroxy-tetrahydrodipicolinate synthase [Demequina sp. B12]MDE0573369.1 4-hydroxy-tetrahydrodipicolinate synthase [Demequina sp. B12]
MTDQRPLGTVLTAMVTPMHDDGSIDIDGAVKVAEYLLAHGSDGLVISGTTGEAPTTHAPEKVELTTALVEAVGDRATIIAGAGSNDTAHAIMMAQQAQECGAHGVLALTPYYSKPSDVGVLAHFEAIAGATDLPIMLYDIPGRTAKPISDRVLDAIAERENVVAVKDATGDIAQARDRIARTGLAWYSGDDPLTLDFLRAGAVGVVSVASHAIGESIARMIAAHDAGDDAAAQAELDSQQAAIEAIMGGGLGAVTAKAAMEALGVIASRHMRLPHVTFDDAEYTSFVALLRQAGVPVEH